MIIAVEGPSATGKTTWCRSHAERFVPEYQPTGTEPNGTDLPIQAMYWVEVNSQRWSNAVELESVSGIALCDSDPLKLHYSWSLARIGAGPPERFEHELAAVEIAFAQERLGFADLTVISIPPTDQLVRRRESDPTRRRRNFDLHARLAEPLAQWYSAIDALDSGRVLWDFPDPLESDRFPPPRPYRSDGELLRALTDALPPLRG
ncbi:hypothetical protein ABH922_001915 [Rhodococcus sp. 27YEA15]|uniref:hypothetical protein n=1 Tax=Rhodococcus sp. 27YEA15 TaxID=3156259 RepID=UPI003C7ACC23